MKIKESEKDKQFSEFARQRKNLKNIIVTVIPVTVGTHATIPKGLVKKLGELEIRGRINNNQRAALIKSTILLGKLQDR